MIQKAILAFCTCLVYSYVSAQTEGLQTILQEIERNNPALRAFEKYAESKTFALKSTNVLPNPEVAAYYLPFGNLGSANYTEMQVSQSFEFPTVYSVRKELINSQEVKMDLEYQGKRQQILLQSKKAIQEIIALKKIEVVEEQRLGQAKTLFEQTQNLYDKGQIGILELNKAKIASIKRQFKLQEIRADKQKYLIEIKTLNGGQAVMIMEIDFEDDFLLPEKDSIWQDRIRVSPTIQFYRQAESVANHQVNLAKVQALPDLTLGYNYQGYLGDHVSGIFAGISIPLWGNKDRRSAALANFSYSTTSTTNQIQAIENELESNFVEHQHLLDVYNEYSSTLQPLNSEALLLKAYQSGEISFSEYYIELEFYQNAYDLLLDMEKQLHILKTEILNHKL